MRPVEVNWVAGKPALVAGPWRPNETTEPEI